jgi:large subunit ribosomal protein L17
MVKPKKGRRLGGDSAHQKAIIRNLALSLIEYERVKTTEAKAKMARMLVERVVHVAKKGDLASRRRCIQILGSAKGAKKLVEEIAPKYADISSGYTRIIKIGNRLGDNAPIVFLEFV